SQERRYCCGVIMEHGTRSYYVKYKCRCEECRKAERDYRRAYEARKRRERGGPVRGRGVTHGTWSGYSHHGCRCQPCTEAASAYRNEWWARNRTKQVKKPAAQTVSNVLLHGTSTMYKEGCRFEPGIRAVVECKRSSGLRATISNTPFSQLISPNPPTATPLPSKRHGAPPLPPRPSTAWRI